MNKNVVKIVILIAILLVGILIYVGNSRPQTKDKNLPPVTVDNPIKGCYVAVIDKDKYTLNIEKVEGDNVSGTLAFKNFQKDSSSGTFTGIYEENILLVDYAFYSEGTYSVMQVIFKKSGEDFIRGYGELDSGGTRFANLSGITYDSTSPLSVFKKSECPV